MRESNHRTMTFPNPSNPRRESRSQNRQFSITVISWQLAAILLVAIVGVLYFAFRGHGISLPPTLGGLQLYREITGDEARRAVADLHDKEVSGGDNLIGFYGAPEGTATLYASVFGGREQAEQMYARMTSLVSHGGSGFGHYSTRTVDGNAVSVCAGMGQVHYFFARGRVVYWLAADLQNGEELLDALLLFSNQHAR